MIPYTLRYTRQAIEALYTIPRGTAGEVSSAIRALGHDPRPFKGFELELPNVFAMKVARYFVTYEIVEADRIVVVLLIEQEQRPAG